MYRLMPGVSHTTALIVLLCYQGLTALDIFLDERFLDTGDSLGYLLPFLAGERHDVMSFRPGDVDDSKSRGDQGEYGLLTAQVVS